MRQLLPEAVDPIEAYEACRPEDPAAPLLRLNFVQTLDGGVADERGRSGTLGGEGDRALFRALRAWADAILVGAGTARTEGYGPHRVSAALAERRAQDGRRAPAAIVVVSGSLDLDFASDLFTQARTPTVVLTHAASPPDRRRAAERVGTVLVAGQDRIDLAGALTMLRADGMSSILCEGGPMLASALLSAGLVDELCLTVAPAVLGRDGPRFAPGLPGRVPLRLRTLLESDSELYLRYDVRPPETGPLAPTSPAPETAVVPPSAADAHPADTTAQATPPSPPPAATAPAPPFQPDPPPTGAAGVSGPGTDPEASGDQGEGVTGEPDAGGAGPETAPVDGGELDESDEAGSVPT